MQEIKCPKCDGKGTMPLPAELDETLAAFRNYPTGATALRMAEDFPMVAQTAISMRLRRLMAMGFLTRRRFGKCQIYSIVKSTAKRK